MESGKKLITLTEDQVNDIFKKAAEIGANEAMRVIQEEKQKARNNRFDKRLQNTRLLLRNYHALKQHAEYSIFGRTQMEESAADILDSMMNMYDDKIIVESIKRSASRTAIMVSHIETMLDLYHTYCYRSSKEIDMRRFNILYDMYIADNILTANEISKKYNISRRNVYLDIGVGIERLSALIFGIDGLKIQPSE